jgi:hypothetical protein
MYIDPDYETFIGKNGRAYIRKKKIIKPKKIKKPK